LQDIDLRSRRTQAGLNRGEARNGLARPLFSNQLGELRDRRFENQSYRASGLNLLVAAIILWNTRYLERALADMGTLDEVARHIAPLGWEHIALTGHYSWERDDRPGPISSGALHRRSWLRDTHPGPDSPRLCRSRAIGPSPIACIHGHTRHALKLEARPHHANQRRRILERPADPAVRGPSRL